VLAVAGAVVAVSSVNLVMRSDSPISKAVYERLLAAPIPFIVLVPSSVPHYFIHDLRNRNWMRAWARRRPKTSTVRVRDMALVIRGVEILSVPARREDDCRADASRAVLRWELRSILGVAWRKALAILETAMAQ
jgi:hypothetical protein